MKIEIKHTSGKYEISLESITQICGENIKIKKFIVDSLDKYFGEKKYAEFEEAYINNILVDDLDVGRKYLDIYVVRSVEDIFNTLRLSKNSLMSKYLVQLISDYNMQAEINGIDEMLSDIFDIINQEINNKIGGVLLDYDTEDIFSMVNKTVIRNENGGFIENINNIELLISYLNILKEIWKIKPNKSLVIFDNIDHILNRQEYRQVLEMCNGITKMYDVNFCFLTSLSGYAVINENFIMGINIVNPNYS